MQSKARMTIRFEPPVKPKVITKPIEQPIELKAEPIVSEDEFVREQVYTSWNSPYQDDIHALEEIIRKSESSPIVQPPQQTTRLQEPRLQDSNHQLIESTWEDRVGELTEGSWSTEHLLADKEQYQGMSWAHGTSARHERGPSWGRVFLSVVAAVATGALFGYLVLSLFTGEPLFPGKSNSDTSIPVQSVPDKTVAVKENTPVTKNNPMVADPQDNPIVNDNAAPTADTTSQVTADVYYMLQYGVFQTEESMETALQQLQDKGLSSASDSSDGYRVYVAAARSRDEAELLAAQLTDTEVYIKPLGGEPLLVSANVLSNEGVAFMNASANLTRKLAQYSGIGLQDKAPQKLDSAQLSELQEAHQQWLDTIPTADKLNNRVKKDGQTVVQALNTAMLSMTEFNRKPSRYHLWSVQSSLMKALLADRHMRLILQPTEE